MRGRLGDPGGVVQLVRTPACHAGGRGFESRRSRSPRKSGRASRDHDDLRGFVLRSVADPAAAAPQREEKERRRREKEQKDVRDKYKCLIRKKYCILFIYTYMKIYMQLL